MRHADRTARYNMPADPIFGLEGIFC